MKRIEVMDAMAKRKAEWQNNYIAKTYDRVNLTLPKGKKKDLQDYVKKNGESLNGFVNRAIDEAMERDNKKSNNRASGSDNLRPGFRA